MRSQPKSWEAKQKLICIVQKRKEHLKNILKQSTSGQENTAKVREMVDSDIITL